MKRRTFSRNMPIACAEGLSKLCRFFTALTLALQFGAAQAAIESVPAPPSTVAPTYVFGNPYLPAFNSPTAAGFCAQTSLPGCANIAPDNPNGSGFCYGTRSCCGDRCSTAFYNIIPICPAGYVLNSSWSCSTQISCPTPVTIPSLPYAYNPSTDRCERTCPPETPLNPATGRCEPACPDHAHGTPCVCDDGYEFDAAKTSCVPKAVCPVTKLDDITDPVAKLYEDGTYSTTNPDIEHITPETQAGLACIKQKVIATNCNRTPQATSGYRPAAYQKHIYDVYRKWQDIKNNDTPECAEVKVSIEIEFLRHGRFAREPGKTSNHSQMDVQGNPAGTAVDIALVPDNALISADAIACQCNMARTVPNDSVHYQPRACPR